MLLKKPYLRSADLAKLFDVNPSTISLWAKKGIIRPQRTLGGNFRFRRSDVEKLIAERKKKGVPIAMLERRSEPRYAFSCPVQVTAPVGSFALSFNAVVRDISNYGMGLEISDSSELSEKLSSGTISELTIQNLPARLFKEAVVGEVRHFQKTRDNRIAIGISLG
jgi:hypothetical protein